MKLLFLTIILIISGCVGNRESGVSYEPVPGNSGFRMDGYWVWGGSVIKVDSSYNMFASRWRKNNMFPENYREDSEIVRATSDSPLGPYEFREVVIGERDSSFWDSNMAHNPTIHKIGEEFVLFYIGSDYSTLLPETGMLIRRVGYATSRSITGPWIRSNEPMIDKESNNPAVLQGDGMIKLIYRDQDLRVFLAESDTYLGPFKIINNNVWPQSRIEDFYLFRKDNRIHLLCEDNVGGISGFERWGVMLHSDDHGYTWEKSDPSVFYNHELAYENGDTLLCTRRERPQLLIEDGMITYLITAVFDGKDSWCQPVKLCRPVKTDLQPE